MSIKRLGACMRSWVHVCEVGCMYAELGACFCLANMGQEPRGQGPYGPGNPGARDQAWDRKRIHGPAQAPDRAHLGSLD